MFASGTFEVTLTPQEDTDFPAGRMSIRKTYRGEMSGTGIGQMISKRTEAGTAAYYAIEEFTGSIAGREGTFTLVHSGYMDASTQSLDVKVLDKSGGGELQSISGSMRIIQDEGGHQYELTYEA